MKSPSNEGDRTLLLPNEASRAETFLYLIELFPKGVMWEVLKKSGCCQDWFAHYKLTDATA